MALINCKDDMQRVLAYSLFSNYLFQLLGMDSQTIKKVLEAFLFVANLPETECPTFPDAVGIYCLVSKKFLVSDGHIHYESE